MARISTTKAYDNKDVIIQINNLKKSVETKQDTLEFDSIPTNGNINPVTSDGIKNALDQKVSVTDFTAHTSDVSNPHSVTKAQVGLSNADNTSDLNKPVSTAMQSALDAKASASALAAHTGSTENPHSVTKAQVGLGNADNTSDADKPISIATQAALDAKQAVLSFDSAPTTDSTNPVTSGGVKIALDAKATAEALTTHIGNTSNPHTVTKAQVGLGNCDNTRDIDKPISTATQTALDAKQSTLTFDSTPTSASTNPVTSGGIYTSVTAVETTANAALPKSGGTMTGALINASGTLTTAQSRNIVISTSDPSGGSSGDVWLVYTV